MTANQSGSDGWPTTPPTDGAPGFQSPSTSRLGRPDASQA